MQIMHTRDRWNTADCLLNLMDGEPFGDALDQNVQGTAQHPVSADQDDAADQDADERIDPQQVSELDQNRGQNDSYRRNSVSHHVQESAVQVEIFADWRLGCHGRMLCPGFSEMMLLLDMILILRTQGDRHHNVDDQANDRNHQHFQAVDGNRMTPAFYRLHPDTDGKDQQGNPVDEGSKNFQSVPAKTMVVIGWKGRQPNRQQAQPQREKIHQHVRSIRKQRQRTRNQATDDFGNQN